MMIRDDKMNQAYRYTTVGGGGIYFIGIGGIGMSALARFFNKGGVKVSGYDKTVTPLTQELESEGIAIHYSEDLNTIPKDAELIVYTPAIPAEHAELQYYQQNGYKVIKRSDVLQLITESSFNICIAGTHGKTTITSMVAHLLRDSGFGCNAFLGGIAANYGTNFWSSNKNICVIEADEYDRSFLKLSPDIAIISAMDADHLDIYGTAEAMEEAFIDFSKKVKNGGWVIGKFGLKRSKELKANHYASYSLQNESADIYAANIKMENGGYDFDVVLPTGTLYNLRLNMGGMHNVENAVVAIAVASSLQIEADKIKAALANFKGVKRRFEYILPPVEKKVKEEWVKPVFIDDYAHHPEELKALITSAKSLFRQRKCTVIFQPHLYSRTRDLADGFAAALSLADEVILLPIYPARELPIENVSSEMIKRKMSNDKVQVMQKEVMMNWLKDEFSKNLNKEFGEVIITAGAGDIDALLLSMKKIIEEVI
jgi:UDP-N-acetylmuramate--alanine ligase